MQSNFVRQPCANIQTDQNNIIYYGKNYNNIIINDRTIKSIKWVFPSTIRKSFRSV